MVCSKPPRWYPDGARIFTLMLRSLWMRQAFPFFLFFRLYWRRKIVMAVSAIHIENNNESFTKMRHSHTKTIDRVKRSWKLNGDRKRPSRKEKQVLFFHSGAKAFNQRFAKRQQLVIAHRRRRARSAHNSHTCACELHASSEQCAALTQIRKYCSNKSNRTDYPT